MLRLAPLLLLLVLTPVSRSQTTWDDRPNIIVFVSDDHRADVLGIAGHPVVQTPHLDGLAERGTRFTEAYVTTSICAASRASILTGLTERTHGYTFGTPPLSAQFAIKSYPARLKTAGYRTGFVGKLGIGIQGGQETIGSMFDSFVPLSRSPYLKTLPDGSTRHVTDLTGDKAIEFIASSPKGTPFCLSVSFNAGHAEDGDLEDHYPFAETEAGLYENVEMPRPKRDDAAVFDALPDYLKESLNRERYHWRWDTAEKYDRNMRNYFRMLTGLDRNIGRVLQQLETQGLTKNTVVIFIGDNGYYMGERGLAGKWSHFDESLSVPLIVLDPRVLSEGAGREETALALNLDLALTVLDAAGIDASATEPMDPSQGISLMPMVRGESAGASRDGFFCEHLMRHEAIPRWVGFRTSEFKYARYLDQTEDHEFLHDLVNDPDELVNLAHDKSHAKQLRAMRGRVAATTTKLSGDTHNRPRVLMLGDSISMGYHQAVVDELATEAVVVRPKENCAGTTKGVQKIDEWLTLEGGGFDIIHFNFGLHDLKRVKPDGKNSNDPADSRQAEPERYEKNLRVIVKKLRQTGAQLIFATTTPFPEGARPRRDPEDAERYNDIARMIMNEHRVAIDDLFSFAQPSLTEFQQPVNVHFTAAGSRVLGLEVAESIRKAIRRRDP